MKFEFSTARRIVFGPGAAEQIPRSGRRLRQTCIPRSRQHAGPLQAHPRCPDRPGDRPTVFSVAGEPTIEMAQAAVKAAREAKADVVVAIGGGSVLDVGKVVAAMLKNEGRPPGLPGGRRQRQAPAGAGRPPDRGPHDRRHRRGGHLQRGARCAGAAGESEHAKPPDGPAMGDRRSPPDAFDATGS